MATRYVLRCKGHLDVFFGEGSLLRLCCALRKSTETDPTQCVRKIPAFRCIILYLSVRIACIPERVAHAVTRFAQNRIIDIVFQMELVWILELEFVVVGEKSEKRAGRKDAVGLVSV